MRPREEKLINEFLTRMNKERGTDFVLSYSPEDVPGELPIEAIALNTAGDRLAIEHTLIESFIGERADNDRFLKAFGALEQDPDLLIDGYDITITMNVGAVPNGVPWTAITQKLKAWCALTFPGLPEDLSTHQVPDLGFPLDVTVDKTWLDEGQAYVFVSRWMPKTSFEDVIRKALTAKLPKLIATTAAERILLVEKNAPPHSKGSVRIALNALAPEFPDLQKAAVWMIDTVTWDTTGNVRVYFVK